MDRDVKRYGYLMPSLRDSGWHGELTRGSTGVAGWRQLYPLHTGLLNVTPPAFQDWFAVRI